MEDEPLLFCFLNELSGIGAGGQKVLTEKPTPAPTPLVSDGRDRRVTKRSQRRAEEKRWKRDGGRKGGKEREKKSDDNIKKF